MNSMPERFTPRSTTCAPLASTSLLPETCSAGALPVPVPVLPDGDGEAEEDGDADAEAEGEAEADGEGEGEEDVETDGDGDGDGLEAPLQATPLTVNEAGAAFVPL
ncbi:hypothetical protein ACFXA5_15260 [Kitasatospora cineracea]|uniref:hypothetical protein n=1 Tax=Kitasatospora cineracea TaxID=88074 RepID=UPI0036CD3E30